MISEVDDRFHREVAKFDLRCTCDDCGAFESSDGTCAYGFPTQPHRRLPLIHETEYRFNRVYR